MNPFSEGLAVAPARFLIGRLELFCEVETPLHSYVMSGSLHTAVLFHRSNLWLCCYRRANYREAELHHHHV